MKTITIFFMRILTITCLCIGLFFVITSQKNFNVCLFSNTKKNTENNTDAYSSRNYTTENKVAQYDHNSELPTSAVITATYEDNNQNLWVGTKNNGLWECRTGQRYFDLNLKIGNTSWITKMFEDNKSDIWVGTNSSGLWEWEKGQSDFIQNQQLPKNSTITQFLQSKDKKTVWFGTQRSGLWELQFQTKSTEIKQDQQISNNASISLIFEDSNENIWVGTEQSSLWECPLGKKFAKNTELNSNSDITAILDDSVSQSIYVGTKNIGLWIGTKTSGASLQKGNLNFVQNIELHAFTIKVIHKDWHTNMWVGTEKAGLWECSAGESKFNQNKQIPSDANIQIIFQDMGAFLRIGTAKQGLWEQHYLQQSVFSQNQQLPLTSDITQIFQDQDGNIDIGTNKNGLWERLYDYYKTSKMIKHTEFPSTTSINIIFQERHGAIMVGTGNPSSNIGHGLWRKRSIGVHIDAMHNTETYEPLPNSGSNVDMFFQSPFSITVTVANPLKSNILNITINKNTYSGSSLDSMINTPIQFPDSKYKTNLNEKINFQITYSDGKTPYNKNLLIKPDYLANGNRADDTLMNSFSGADSDGAIGVYVKEDFTNVKYHLYTAFSNPNKSSPSLTITPRKLNFLTNYNLSHYENINIKKGKIIKQNQTIISKTIPIKIKGTKVSNLYEVDLIDYVGNKDQFLVQVGGSKLDTNLTRIKNKKTNAHSLWVIGVVAGVMFIVVIGFIISRVYKRPKNKLDSLTFFRSKGSNLAIDSN